MKRWSSSRTLPCLSWSSIYSQKLRSDWSLRREKQSWTANGSDNVMVRTRHGVFVFKRRRFLDRNQTPQTLLPAAMSAALRQRIGDWATRFPFSEVASLLDCG